MRCFSKGGVSELAFFAQCDGVDGMRLSVGFEANSHITGLMKGALKMMMPTHAMTLRDFLYPALSSRSWPAMTNAAGLRSWISLTELNAAQSEVVERIVTGRGRAAPYLVSGPPGTGKTRTLAHAVAALHTFRDGNILVVSPTNAAVVVIVERLRQLAIPAESIVRIVSPSRPWDGLPPEVQEVSLCKCARCSQWDAIGGGGGKMPPRIPMHACPGVPQPWICQGASGGPCHGKSVKRRSNYSSRTSCYRCGSPAPENRFSGRIDRQHDAARKPRGTSHRRPVRGDLIGKRVVVATLHQAAAMADSPVLNSLIQYGYFSTIMCDEASQATEPLVLAAVVPLLLARASAKDERAQLVLFGDVKQLGPVVTSQEASDAGLNIALMERLSERKAYRRDGPFHTLLTEAYRCHDAIIDFSNASFYNTELLPSAPSRSTCVFEGWDELPVTTHHHPVVVQNVAGDSETGGDAGYSFQNPAEVHAVLLWVRKILASKRLPASEIGIIAPYASQVRLIEEALGSAASGISAAEGSAIKVATAERFQGQERGAIIISTTRGETDETIGFVADPRRMNVMLTRAKALLVVVCSTTALERRSGLWRDFVRLQRGEGACI